LYPVVGGIRFLLNFLSFLPDYTQPHPKPQQYSRIISLNKINSHTLKSTQSESTHLDDNAIKNTVYIHCRRAEWCSCRYKILKGEPKVPAHLSDVKCNSGSHMDCTALIVTIRVGIDPNKQVTEVTYAT
jgi:hypothetical protein